MADRVACDELHDAGNILADASEAYHGCDDDVGSFDPSSAHACQGHEKDAGGEGEEAERRGVREAPVIDRHPRLAAVVGVLGLQKSRAVYVILCRRRGRHAVVRCVVLNQEFGTEVLDGDDAKSLFFFFFWNSLEGEREVCYDNARSKT